MLTEQEIENYKVLVEKATRAKSDLEKIKTEVDLHKKQGIAKLKAKGYSSLADLPKIEEKITSMEEEITASTQEMTDYIKLVSEKKEQKERIIMGLGVV